MVKSKSKKIRLWKVQGQRPSGSRSKVREDIICEMQLKCGKLRRTCNDVKGKAPHTYLCDVLRQPRIN